jgi:hypothetical protein
MPDGSILFFLSPVLDGGEFISHILYASGNFEADIASVLMEFVCINSFVTSVPRSLA